MDAAGRQRLRDHQHGHDHHHGHDHRRHHDTGHPPAAKEEQPVKFQLFVLPTVPATMEERERLRPIGRNNERFQMMIDEVRTLCGIADDAGLRLLLHHRAPLPLRGLRGVGGAAPAVRRPGGADQADQVRARSRWCFRPATRCAPPSRSPTWTT